MTPRPLRRVWKSSCTKTPSSSGAKERNRFTKPRESFNIEHVPANMTKEGVFQGGNLMNNPAEDHTWWDTLVDWEHAWDKEAVRPISINTTAKWDQLAKARGLSLPFGYMNHAGGDQDPLASYGAENLAKLHAVARKYDPGQVFQRLQSGGFSWSSSSA